MWNVNGLMCKSTNYNKLHDPLFFNMARGYDIITVVETGISPDQPLAADGYYTCRTERPKSKHGRHFVGEWAVLIKYHLKKNGIKVLEQTYDFVCMKLCKELFQIYEDIYTCLAYISPSDSELIYWNRYTIEL